MTSKYKSPPISQSDRLLSRCRLYSTALYWLRCVENHIRIPGQMWYGAMRLKPPLQRRTTFLYLFMGKTVQFNSHHRKQRRDIDPQLAEQHGSRCRQLHGSNQSVCIQSKWWGTSRCETPSMDGTNACWGDGDDGYRRMTDTTIATVHFSLSPMQTSASSSSLASSTSSRKNRISASRQTGMWWGGFLSGMLRFLSGTDMMWIQFLLFIMRTSGLTGCDWF